MCFEIQEMLNTTVTGYHFFINNVMLPKKKVTVFGRFFIRSAMGPSYTRSQVEKMQNSTASLVRLPQPVKENFYIMSRITNPNKNNGRFTSEEPLCVSAFQTNCRKKHRNDVGVWFVQSEQQTINDVPFRMIKILLSLEHNNRRQ